MAWTSPRTWVAAEKPSAATLNTHIRDNFRAVGDAWPTYTGGDTNVTVGNGTLTKRAMQAGKLIHFSIELTWGSTTAFPGTPRFGLPVTPRITTQGAPLGRAYMLDTSAPASRLWHVSWIATASGVAPLDDSFSGVTSTAPWTWGTGDLLIMTGSYESA